VSRRGGELWTRKINIPTIGRLKHPVRWWWQQRSVGTHIDGYISRVLFKFKREFVHDALARQLVNKRSSCMKSWRRRDEFGTTAMTILLRGHPLLNFRVRTKNGVQNGLKRTSARSLCIWSGIRISKQKEHAIFLNFDNRRFWNRFFFSVYDYRYFLPLLFSPRWR